MTPRRPSKTVIAGLFPLLCFPGRLQLQRRLRLCKTEHFPNGLERQVIFCCALLIKYRNP